MFTKFNLYIGLNDKDSKVQELSALFAATALLQRVKGFIRTKTAHRY